MLPTAAGFVFMTSLKANQKPTNSCCRLGIIEKVFSPVSLQFPSLTQTLSKLQSIFLLRSGPAIILMSAKMFWISQLRLDFHQWKKKMIWKKPKSTHFLFVSISLPGVLAKTQKTLSFRRYPESLEGYTYMLFSWLRWRNAFPAQESTGNHIKGSWNTKTQNGSPEGGIRQRARSVLSTGS